MARFDFGGYTDPYVDEEEFFTMKQDGGMPQEPQGNPFISPEMQKAAMVRILQNIGSGRGPREEELERARQRQAITQSAGSPMSFAQALGLMGSRY